LFFDLSIFGGVPFQMLYIILLWILKFTELFVLLC
jgi:hypothetical protein